LFVGWAAPDSLQELIALTLILTGLEDGGKKGEGKDYNWNINPGYGPPSKFVKWSFEQVCLCTEKSRRVCGSVFSGRFVLC